MDLLLHTEVQYTLCISAEWLQAGGSRPKCPRTQRSAGKVMGSIFWDAHSIIFIDYFEKGKAIIGEYCVTLLDQLNEEIEKKWPHLKNEKILFQDKAPAHSSIKVMVKLDSLGYELVPHSAYSPGLAPSYYYLFPNLKRWLQGKRLHTNEKVISETQTYFAEFDKSYYTKGIKILEDCSKKCISL